MFGSRCKNGTHYFKNGHTVCQCGQDRLQPHEVQQPAAQPAAQPKRGGLPSLLSFSFGRGKGAPQNPSDRPWLNLRNPEDRLIYQNAQQIKQDAEHYRRTQSHRNFKD